MADDAELVRWLRKATSAIYLACDEAVADKISPKLAKAALRIEELSAECEKLRASLKAVEPLLGKSRALSKGAE